MHQHDTTLFEEFTRPMIGQPLSHVWFGYGSAVFLEFGTLTPSTIKRRDGSHGDPHGEFGVMIGFVWRLEGRRYILCGSESDEDDWQPAFDRLRGTSLTGMAVTGRLPELDLSFSNEMHCSSFQSYKGHPEWAIFDRRGDTERTLISRKGRVELERPSRPFKS